MGFDAFGLPAENHALKTNTHPADNTKINMDIMVRQLDTMGGMYPWEYSYATCFPDYYKWTQWLFLQLFEAGLCYQKEAPVNWCDKCKTVLANEQVVGGECERCGTGVVRRNMKQWFIKITDYAEKLLAGLDGLDWPNKTKVMQKNWIGKSMGAHINFKIVGAPEGTEPLRIFTTRPDTIYGVTFMVIAPEHPMAHHFITEEHKKSCHTYMEKAAKKSDVERQATDRTKTGVFTGGYVINPANNEQIPVWLADYVLATYGTGAIMAVPAYDERDEEFAKEFKLPIVRAPLTDKLFGERATTYRLRDWSIGRQRYWGCPIPVVYCPHCGTVPVSEKDLPVTLPHIMDFKPKGASPLASVPEFVNCTCPKCGAAAKRECDTMDTFVCSSWYFLRYPFAKRDDVPFEKSVRRVDKYIGGAEHACMHLLYARFITQFLHDQKKIAFSEPFPSLVHQGMILAKDGSKMSKSKGNTVTPDEYVNKYGSDILRLFMLFAFKFTDGGPWNEDMLKTVTRFTARIEKVIADACGGNDSPARGAPCAIPHTPSHDLLYTQANTIKSVREDLESFSFNTAVARCMEFLNAIEGAQRAGEAVGDAIRTLVLLVAPMLPHIAEEYWEMLGEKPSIFDQKYPEPDHKHLTRAEVEIAVQINSKIVGRITVPSDATQHHVEKACEKFTSCKKIEKVVYIKGRLINYIIKE